MNASPLTTMWWILPKYLWEDWYWASRKNEGFWLPWEIIKQNTSVNKSKFSFTWHLQIDKKSIMKKKRSRGKTYTNFNFYQVAKCSLDFKKKKYYVVLIINLLNLLNSLLNFFYTKTPINWLFCGDWSWLSSSNEISENW